MMKLYLALLLCLLYACVPGGIEKEIENYENLSKNKSGLKESKERYFLKQVIEKGALDEDVIGNYKLAMVYVDSALSENPFSTEAYRLKSELFQLMNQIDEALVAINEGLRIDSTDPNSYIKRANVYHQLGNREMALEDYYKVIEIDAENGPALEAIGYMEIDMGNNEVGCEFLLRARITGYNTANSFTDSLICNQ